MPGKDGLSLLEELKSQGIATPVVMMSGQAHIDMAVRATTTGRARFSGKADLHRKAAADGGERAQVAAAGIGESAAPPATGKTRDGVDRRNHEEADGPDRARGRERDPGLHSGRDRNREGIGRAHAARTQSASFRPIRHAELRRGSGGADRVRTIRSREGSFTGAAGRHVGKFEQAERGTIFLDEIGDMPLAMQAKLLRVLEEGEVERIGGDKPTQVDVRVVVATHRNLESLVREGKFRQDLFHRIYVFPIMLPPLRDRKEDIPALVQHFAEQVCAQNNWKPVPFTPEAIRSSGASLAGQYSRTAQRGGTADTAGDRSGSDRGHSRMALPQAPRRSRRLAGTGTLAERVQGFEREVILAELKRQPSSTSPMPPRRWVWSAATCTRKPSSLGIDLQPLRHEPGECT